MSEHLSALQLDEIAAGLAPGSEHLAGCAQCSQRLEALKAQNAAFLARPEAKRQLEQLAPAPSRRNVVRWLAVAAPLAAGLALLLAWPGTQPTERIKGAPTVVLLDEQGSPVTHASVGQKLTLAVGAAGFQKVRVFSVAASGARDELFSGAISAGAQVPLMQLEVTPGSVYVVAEFEDGEATASASVRLEVVK